MASALRVASRLPRPCARAALRVSCAPATPLCATRSLLTQQPPTSRFAPGIFPASRALLPRAAMGGAFSRAARVGAAADPGASEAQTEHTLMQNKAQQQDAANKFHMTPVDAKILQRMLDELGLDTPHKLRAFITKRSLPVLGLSLLESVLNGVGAYCALLIFGLLPWDAAVLVQRGWSPMFAALMAGAGQASSALAAAALGMNAIFSGATFFATLYASLAFDINARSFLQTVHQQSGGVGIGLPHAGRRAAASLKAVQQLAAMHEMLEARAAARGAPGRPSSRSLAVHLGALADRGGGRGLGLAALALAPEEAATLARLFARHDADGDDKLTAAELRAVMAELTPADKQPVSEEAARAALSILDADGDGLVELDEFAAWYATARLWRHGGEPAALEGASKKSEVPEGSRPLEQQQKQD